MSDEEYEAILEEAGRRLRQATGGVRGQTVTKINVLDYWIAVVTRERIAQEMEREAAEAERRMEGWTEGDPRQIRWGSHVETLRAFAAELRSEP